MKEVDPETDTKGNGHGPNRKLETVKDKIISEETLIKTHVKENVNKSSQDTTINIIIDKGANLKEVTTDKGAIQKIFIKSIVKSRYQEK